MEIEHQIQLTDVTEEMIQYLHKQMNTFKVSQLVVRDVDTHWEEKARVTSIDDLVCSKLSQSISNKDQCKVKMFHFMSHPHRCELLSVAAAGIGQSYWSDIWGKHDFYKA